LHPARHARQFVEGPDGSVRRAAGRDDQAERRERVHRLELTSEREHQLVPLPEDIHNQYLAADPGISGYQPQIGRRTGTIGDYRMAAITAERLKPRKFVAVFVEDSGSTRSQQGGEEAFFGGPVIRHIAVIVEVIACQIGEPRCGNGEAVKPELMEPVTRRFYRQVLDPLRRQLCEITMKRHRVRAGQRAGSPPGAGHQSERAEARRRSPYRLPNLAREMDHRGLAVRTGDCGDRLRLSAVEARRQQSQTATRVDVGHDGDPVPLLPGKRKRGGIVGQDRRCAALYRVSGETAPVLPGTR